ncbi:MAG: V-type ATP synthase subunit D [Coriobacteriia bacterium]|nr:V-type ATP synthase subunit D [Coriobacteriia bacterium]
MAPLARKVRQRKMAASLRNVSANRMTLLKLRQRLDMSTRGHKLLKDKLDELMRVFLERVHENRELRTKVERHLRGGYALMALAYAQAGEEALDEALVAGEAGELVEVTMQNVMSVRVPNINVDDIPAPAHYSYALTPAVLDGALGNFTETFPLMLELAGREKAIELLAAKIEATRRRVNALEHVLIPQLEEAVRSIRMKIEENERSERTRLVKVKDLLAASEPTSR